MVQVNALGDTCPLPVIKTMNALKELGGAGTVEVLVDNEIAVQNLTRLAENKGCTIETEKRSEKEYRVTLTTGEAVERTGDEANLCTTPKGIYGHASVRGDNRWRRAISLYSGRGS